jgi:hypothetical protein
MIENLIYVESLVLPEVDRREVLRYAGVRESNPEIEQMLDQCLSISNGKLSGKVCYRIFEAKAEVDAYDLGFTKTTSRSLVKTIDGCERVLVFCATVGADFDRLISKYSIISPSVAVLLQALGTERVEALCDAFCDEMKAEAGKRGGFTRPRFSAGYGDLPLSLQREIFRALSPEKHIGAYLRESLIASPSKTVTAIIGVGKK